MITGDHRETALAIGKMLGIAGSGLAVTGPEVDGMDAETLKKLAPECNIYARASPENKIRIVRALQVQGAEGSGRGRPQALLAAMRAGCTCANVLCAMPPCACVLHAPSQKRAHDKLLAGRQPAAHRVHDGRRRQRCARTQGG